MEFRIADTFTSSLSRLTGDEQKAVKTAVFDLQVNPAHPSLQLHKLDKAKDHRFWSARVTSDLRIILHRTDVSLLLCFVAHHDDAYHWAERRKLETHPKTGAAQLVEVRETVVEIPVPRYVEEKRLLFTRYTDDDILSLGVPAEWLADVRQATEDSLLALADHLPAEAAEALLELATGAPPRRPTPTVVAPTPFEHPDALRRFRVMHNYEELARALDAPWEKWIVFLHPAQRQFVERHFAGPARVSGSAGTGKTIVAVHRAAHLARANPAARVLLATFSDPLAQALSIKLRALLHHEPRLGERIEVHSLEAIATRLFRLQVSTPSYASETQLRAWLREAAAGTAYAEPFLWAEWYEIVDAWQVRSWEAYRDVSRVGRRTRLTESQRAALWPVFEKVQSAMVKESLTTRAAVLYALVDRLVSGSMPAPFDFAVIDEAQDVGIAQLRFLAALAGGKPDGLFFAGDLGQRIFQAPFSWKSLGVDVRGRATTLKINYRTSHQIRQHADRLLTGEVADVDGNVEERRGTVSIFNGPAPAIRVTPTEKSEIDAVGTWLRECVRDGVQPHEIGLFVRSRTQFSRALAALKAAELSGRALDDDVDIKPGFVSLASMHLAKGLEFRAVGVMACDDDVLPLQSRVESAQDEADLDEVYNTERHLLYVACTRARDRLLITGVDPGSEFLNDILRTPRR
jgi:mRNA-degrading endonuclease RelE of RelBE toxin-antitoxin system